MKLYAIRKKNKYLWVRCIDTECDVPLAGRDNGGVYSEEFNKGFYTEAIYWADNITPSTLFNSPRYMKFEQDNYGGELITYTLTEDKE